MAVERIKYQAGNVTAHGALVWNDKIATRRPLLLVMSNWLGVTDTIIKRAEKMAGDKYIAFVGCMYGEGKTAEGPPESQDLMMAVRSDRVEGRKRVNAALQTMIAEAEKRGIGDSSKKAAVGFCFGGGNVLELARSGADLDAVVCLHGDLATSMPAKKGDIKAAIFVIHGSKDPVAPKADRDALEAELDGAEANWQLLDFGGRLHSFSEEETDMPGFAKYHAGAAHQTYRMLDDFIQDAFAKRL
ncbi:MAG: dienelactone hydrolase family protein [Pseudorhodoplanes sp.]|uniref:dienelactone hydrolase family protein n=1 Tax=Pseudorhodoplanes sp. TaxID=1934341 RepID=UPI003D0F493B